jgi:predicted dehydrogenase
MAEKIKWGIIGCGNIVENRFLPALSKEVLNGELYAIASSGKSERFARVVEHYKPLFLYHDYNDLLVNKDIDAVYIPLPNSLHAAWSIKAMRAGKHVLCEKPIACSLNELNEMEKAAVDNHVHLMEAFACLHSPLYPTIRHLILNGEIGEIRSVSAVFCDNITGVEHLVKKDMGGGSIFDVGCYSVLSIRQITAQEPVSVKAIASYLPGGVDATVIALFEMENKMLAGYTSSINSARKREISVLGSEGHISFMHTPNAWGEQHILLANRSSSKDISLTIKNTYASEIEQFGRCILNGEKPFVTIEESKKNIKAMEMLLQSI